MKFVIFLILSVFTSHLIAEECSKIKHFDEIMSEIYVVCPTLEDLDEPTISYIVSDIFSSRDFVPDEYIINFVISVSGLPPKKLTSENHIGWYYTHDHKVRIWPKDKSKSEEVQLAHW